MIINKVKLENIRSYLNEEINFPTGSILLSGDVGSGKSTILLAIDFALFGLRKGSLAGNSLLRNGKNKGFVELNFRINGDNVIIKRSLKRVNNNVVQDSGIININGVIEEKSPLELKQMVLELLNYPKELLMKSKSLVYRYTIYTPQEEMKTILMAEKDLRIDALRKVFGIDKYKLVRENSRIFINKLKERKKELDGRIMDLENKKLELKNEENNSKSIEDKISRIEVDIEKVQKKINDKRNDIKDIEKNIKDLEELKKKVDIIEINLKHKNEKINTNNETINLLEEQITALKDDIKEIVEEDINKLINGKKNELKDFEKNFREVSLKVNQLRARKDNSLDVKEKIKDLDFCPVCRQSISREHKDGIGNEEDKKIKEIEEILKHLEKEGKDIEIKVEELKEDIDSLVNKEKLLAVNKVKKKSYDEKLNLKNSLIKIINNLEEEIKILNGEREKIVKDFDNFKNIAEDYEIKKNELEDLLEKQKDVIIEKASLETELKNSRRLMERLEEEIVRKNKVRENVNKLDKIVNWLEEEFDKLMIGIERQIMLKIHYDFNELFEKWFNILMDDENLKVKLDDEFTPLIEQNGHDIEYNYLSGGEKTAGALAYRLALNQVINNLLTRIRTKDLLILDEPTDGFSEEQLDRIRLVLDELNIKQVIIVSHEAKIESFVDSIIRIRKEGHVSKVV